jgi:hypothetical protein
MPLELINLTIGVVFLSIWAIAGRIHMRQNAARGETVKTSALYRPR